MPQPDLVIKAEVQLTAKELVQQTTNGHKEGQHVNHPPRVSSHSRWNDGQEVSKCQRFAVVVNEATGIVEETKTPAGQEATAGFFALEFASTTRAVSAQSLPAPKSTIETFPVAQTDWTSVRQ